MLFQIVCGLVAYKLCKSFLFYSDDVLNALTSDFNAIFSVANRLEKLYGGKAFVGLRIPDPDTSSLQTIDIVLVTEKVTEVILVKNLSGLVSVNADGSWVSEGRSRRREHPDPVAEVKRQVSVLESYLEQRGLSLPEGYISCRVVLPNEKLRTNIDCFPSEVITYEKWVQLKPEPRSGFSRWVKGVFRGDKKETQESIQQQLISILTTAPIWDRLQLKGNLFVLGDFVKFKGKQEDISALRNVKRSKVSRLVIQKTAMFGLAPSTLQILYSLRDYRRERASANQWREVTVSTSTEVLFRPKNSSKVRKFNLFSTLSMSLSA